MYLYFDNVCRVNITDCVIQSWPSGGLRLVVDRNKKQEDLLDVITALFKLALQSHRSADYKAVLDDSSITVDTTSLDQHKLFLLVIFVP